MLRSLRPALLACATALTAGGCATRAVELPSPVELPERFSVAGGESVPARWWLALEDPRLEALIEQALDGNPGLAQAGARLEQARALAEREGADLYPSLDLQAGGTRRFSEFEGSGLARSTSDELTLGGTASWELDLWGRVRATRDAAALEAEASAEDLRAAAVSLSAEVALSWYQLVEQRAQLELLDRQIDTNERVLELITLRFRRGLAGAADVLRQRDLVEATRGERVLAEAAVRAEHHRLAALLGRSPVGAEFDAPAQLPELPGLPDTGLPVALVERRPDVRSARLAVAAADREVAAAIADRYPRLSLTASGAFTAEELEDLFDNWIASLAADVVAPVLDGGRRAAEVERVEAVLEERLAAYAEAVLTALGEVENALSEERARDERIAVLERRLTLSGEVVERLSDAYRNGATSYLDVLDALLGRQTLERSLLTTRRERIDARVALARALAGGWPSEEDPDDEHH